MSLAACGIAGIGKSSSSPTTTTTPQTVAATTTTIPHASVEVRPPSGAVGTSFSLLATRFIPTENVTFEIDFPSGKVFKGTRSHPVAADGTATGSYLVTTGNPAGTYQVKATGDKGTLATGQFEVTAGSATSTTSTGRTTTTLRTATTLHTTTTKKP